MIDYKKKVEKIIKQTLVIQNKQSIPRAVEEITDMFIENPIIEEQFNDIRLIVKVVSQHVGIKEYSFFYRQKDRKVSWAKHIVMYFARRFTDHNSKDITNLMGGLSHSIVNHAIKTVKQQCDVNKKYREMIKNIEFDLEQKYGF